MTLIYFLDTLKSATNTQHRCKEPSGEANLRRKEKAMGTMVKAETRRFRIRGTWYTVEAPCVKAAIRKLVTEDGDFTYTPHWYTGSNRKSWAEVTTSYGYECIVEEV